MYHEKSDKSTSELIRIKKEKNRPKGSKYIENTSKIYQLVLIFLAVVRGNLAILLGAQAELNAPKNLVFFL